MTEEGFSPDYADEEEYEYKYRDGTEVKVRIRERRNGGKVGVYHYDEDGSRLSYYTFNIRSLEHRELVASGSVKEKEIPESVATALHAGGWQLANMEWGDLTPDPDDPVEVQLLDIRDGFREYAKQTETALIEEYFTAMARAVEIGLTTDAVLHMISEDEDVAADKAFEAAKQIRTGNVDMSRTEMIEGWFINAADPSTETAREEQDRVLNALETAREAYRRGHAFGETFEEAYYSLS